MSEEIEVRPGILASIKPEPNLPPKVAAAISAVMADVPRLAKGEKNTHGNYNFASIDDFLEAIRPLCAKAGLIILMDEEHAEIIDGGVDRSGKPVRWLSIAYRFTLAHSSGETWSHAQKRTIFVNTSLGSQAFGAAQSYALKNFLRSLFQVATGENDDVDFQPNETLPKRPGDGVRGAAAGPKMVNVSKDAETPEKPMPEGVTKTALKAKSHELVREIHACEDLDSLLALHDSSEYRKPLLQMKEWYPDGFDAVLAAQTKRKGELEQTEVLGAG